MRASENKAGIRGIKLQALFKDPEDFNHLIKACRLKSFTGNEGSWIIDKTHLVALAIWLMENGYFLKEVYPRTVLQSAFTKQFRVSISDRFFRYEILIEDEYNYVVVLPLEKSLKHKEYKWKKYFSKLEKALNFIVDQKSRLQASEIGRIALKKYIRINTLISRKILSEVLNQEI